MNCNEKNRIFSNKPKRTNDMINKDQVYVWKEVMGNPNLYCWIPVSKQLTNSIVDIEEMNIQDIPQPPVPKNYEDIVAQFAEEALDRQRKLSVLKVKKEPSDEAIVSIDEVAKYKIVKEFIQKKGLKLYGGAAINSYLPKEDKFYNSNDIPDYDFFSPDPWNNAVELADIFFKNGYKYVETRAGIHKGTYKVFVNLWPVADISYMNKKDFDQMKTKTIGGIKIVSPFKLLEAMYKEFSEPFSNPSRWPKVASREKLLVNWTQPLSKKFKCSKLLFSGGQTKVDPIIEELLVSTYKFIIDKKLIFYGPIAYNTYIELGGGNKRLVTDHYCVLSEYADNDIKELMDLLMKKYEHLEITTHFSPSRELNDTTYKILAVIDNKHHEICTIAQVNNCTPYKYLLNRYIVSIDYLKYDLYYTVVFDSYKDIINDTKCKLQYLEKIQNLYYKSKKISETDSSPFQRFVTNCTGPYGNNLKIEILNRWLDRISSKDNVERIWSPTHRIRKYPREIIPEHCKDVPKEQCVYPCAWNKYIGKCTGIPKGTYRAGEDNEDIHYEFQE
jgi:hypothetical protein